MEAPVPVHLADESSLPGSFPENPVLCRLWRGGWVESQHRGSWARVDASGAVLEGAGDHEQPVFARSAIKCLQALPLLESGAAERAAYDEADLALALSSHNAEAQHTERVSAILARLGLGASDLGCGPQPPGDPEARKELRARGGAPSALMNNCSGKHAGFLALAQELDQDPATYLEAEGAVQRAVREAVGAMCDLEPGALEYAIDGCSAPTWRLSPRAMATAMARVGEPSGLSAPRAEACRRMTRAVALHPALIAGEYKRLCTALVRASEGRLFPKIGAEAVYVIAHVGTGEGLALKIDDGSQRALHATVIGLLRRLGWLDAAAADSLERFAESTLTNWAGLEVGRTEVLA